MGAWSSGWTGDLEIGIAQTDNRKEFYKIDAFFKENSEYLLVFLILYLYVYLMPIIHYLYYCSLEIGSMSLPTLYFLLKIGLVILALLLFHKHFRYIFFFKIYFRYIFLSFISNKSLLGF